MIEKLTQMTRVFYDNNVAKINELVNKINQVITDLDFNTWRLDRNINPIPIKDTNDQNILDLDLYTMPGTYTCKDGTSAATLLNIPLKEDGTRVIKSNFRLIVTENIAGYITQEIQTYNGQIWRRGHAGGNTNTWYTWHKIAYEDSTVNNAKEADHATTADHANNADYATTVYVDNTAVNLKEIKADTVNDIEGVNNIWDRIFQQGDINGI